MELRQIVSNLLKWWWLMVISVLVAGAASYLGTRSQPRTYLARTTMMVGQVMQNPNPSQSEFSTSQLLAQSYADISRREPVLQATLDALGLKWDWNALKVMVSGRVVPGTQLLEISVLDTDPPRAKILVEQIARQLILQSPAGADVQKEAERQFVATQMGELKANITKSQEEIHQLDDVIAKAASARQIQDARTRQSALQTQISGWQATYAQLGTVLQSGASNFLSVVEPAQVPTTPVGPRVAVNVLLAMAIGLVLSGGAAVLLEYLDDTLHSSDDVRHALGLMTLGSIPPIDGQDYPSKLVVSRFPRAPVAEAYRLLRTNLQHAAGGQPLHTLMVTSANPLEGKSVTTANLAAALAQSGQQVILVDADMRRPTQHHIHQLDNDTGLSVILQQDDVGLEQVLRPSSIVNLSIITSGPLADNPPDLLGSERMDNLIDLLLQQADIVIFDCPPVEAASDAIILASRLDGALLVVDAGHTRRASAQRSRDALMSVGANLLGVVLNRLATSRSGYYYYSSDDGERKRRSKRASLASLFGQAGHSAEQTVVSATLPGEPEASDEEPTLV